MPSQWKLPQLAVPLLLATACGGLPDGSDRGSQPAEIAQRMGSTELRVVYGRPMARGRVLFGELVPYDSIWNPGANEATRIEISEDIRIEGEPLLVEDLVERRAELKTKSEEILQQSQGWLKDEIQDRVYSRFFSRGFLWQQLSQRESLKAAQARAREEFKERLMRLATAEERDLLISAVETAVTARRVDALLLLHRSLRVWIPAHVISTALMLALMIVHVIQVVFFEVR